MEQPIPHGFDLETTLGFLLHPLVEAGENGDKAVRLGHVGGEAEDHVSGPPTTPARQEWGACDGGREGRYDTPSGPNPVSHCHSLWLGGVMAPIPSVVRRPSSASRGADASPVRMAGSRWGEPIRRRQLSDGGPRQAPPPPHA